MATFERTVKLTIPMKVQVSVDATPAQIRHWIGEAVAEKIESLKGPMGPGIHSFTMDVKVDYDQVVLKDDNGSINQTYYGKVA